MRKKGGLKIRNEGEKGREKKEMGWKEIKKIFLKGGKKEKKKGGKKRKWGGRNFKKIFKREGRRKKKEGGREEETKEGKNRRKERKGRENFV